MIDKSLTLKSDIQKLLVFWHYCLLLRTIPFNEHFQPLKYERRDASVKSKNVWMESL